MRKITTPNTIARATISFVSMANTPLICPSTAADNSVPNRLPTPPTTTTKKPSTIIQYFVGVSFLIYNWKKFIPITVSEDMVGHKFGEFAPTRQFFGHTPADKKAKVEGGAKGTGK